ncbi:MAG: mechanosensitive ion channel domain-containing protein [Acidobacteriota bacterium]
MRQTPPTVESLTQGIAPFVPLLLTVAASALVLWVAHWLFLGRQRKMGNERKFARQLVMLGLTLAAMVTIILTLPVSESMRNQVLGLFGLVVSGIIAFSSTTVTANLMAGLMLRVTQPFRTGDFVEVDGQFGRVAERGLLDTEIQTEHRELIALPNTLLIREPVSVVQKSGAIVSCSLSLGYDIHHRRVESALMDAAHSCGLEDPFVHVLSLGDFSINYRVHGLLREVKGLLTARSDLRRKVLDTLHGKGIEIVSPTFMNQRQVHSEAAVLAEPPPLAIDESAGRAAAGRAEAIVFDKAEAAERLEEEADLLRQEIAGLDQAKAELPPEEQEDALGRLAEIRQRLAELAAESSPKSSES